MLEKLKNLGNNSGILAGSCSNFSTFQHPVDEYEGSRAGQAMKSGSKITELKGAHLILDGESHDREPTNSTMCKQERPKALLV